MVLRASRALLAGDSNRYVDRQADEPELAKRSPKTAKQALGVLRRICNVAVLDSAITANPALVKLTTSSKRNARTKFKHCPLTPGQIAALSDYVGGIYGLAITFTGFTGLRAAELAGLEIGDVLLTDAGGQVRVQRTKTREVGGFRSDLTKTDESERTVPLESWLAADLHTYLVGHPRADEPTAPLFPGRLTLAEAKRRGRNVKDSADRFDWSKPIDPNNVYKRFMQPALAALKLPAARFHDLRHSFAVPSFINLVRSV
jgi:integrase